MLTPRWRIEMFGGLRVQRGSVHVSRFQSQKIASLLAYLAYYSGRPHMRDELIDLLWQDDDFDAARNRLRVGLSSLRQCLEPEGVSRGSVLSADRLSVQLAADSFTTDTSQFEAALAAAHRCEGVQQFQLYNDAVNYYSGELLPGLSDSWVVMERDRLAQSHLQALHRLTRCLVKSNDLEGALVYARRAVKNDPVREEAHRDVMRLYLALGQPTAAQAQYEEAKRTLQNEIGTSPSIATQKLAHQISESLGRSFSPNVLVHSRDRYEKQTVEDTGELAVVGTRSIQIQGLRGSIPKFLTRFFGREEEKMQIYSILGSRGSSEYGDVSQARLLTLTGPGGIGKTRLAVAAAEALCKRFSDNVWFVPLADVTDARMAPNAIAAVLNLPASNRSGEMNQLIEALSAKEALLILDNCEHLADDLSHLFSELLRLLPGLSCLLTSRRVIGIDGEREFVVAPLPTPLSEGIAPGASAAKGAGSEVSIQEMATMRTFASVELFVDRAQAVHPGFQPTPTNIADIASLCGELDGIPLAIELAASRARVVTPAEMRANLLRRFDLLVNCNTEKDHRHRSLRATLEWSVQLLSPELRSLFARLSTFAGGWNTRSAMEVCITPSSTDSATLEPLNSRSAVRALDIEPRLQLLEKLEQLRINSLIIAEEIDDEIRFRMLETIREFAAELVPHNDQEDLRTRYVDYFVSFIAEHEHQIKGAGQSAGFRRLYSERDNLRAVFDACLQSEDRGETALFLTRALKRFWSVRGLVAEGRQRSLSALAHDGAQSPSPLRVDALLSAGSLIAEQDDFDFASQVYQQALDLAKSISYDTGVARAVDCLGVMEMRRGKYVQANELFERALNLSRRTGDRINVASSLNHLALTAQISEKTGPARSLYEQALALHAELGDQLAMAQTLGNLGMLSDSESDFVTARKLHEQGLALHRELGNPAGIAASLGNLAIIWAKNGEYAKARKAFQEIDEIFTRLAMVRAIAILKGNMGSLEALEGNHEEACLQYKQSLELHRQLDNRPGTIHALWTLVKAYSKQEDLAKSGAYVAECIKLCYESGQFQTLSDLLTEAASLEARSGRCEQSAWFDGAAAAIAEHHLGKTPSDSRTPNCNDEAVSNDAHTNFSYTEVFHKGYDASPEEVIAAADAAFLT